MPEDPDRYLRRAPWNEQQEESLRRYQADPERSAYRCPFHNNDLVVSPEKLSCPEEGCSWSLDAVPYYLADGSWRQWEQPAPYKPPKPKVTVIWTPPLGKAPTGQSLPPAAKKLPDLALTGGRRRIKFEEEE